MRKIQRTGSLFDEGFDTGLILCYKWKIFRDEFLPVLSLTGRNIGATGRGLLALDGS